MNLRSWHQNVLVVIEFFTVTCALFCFVFLKPLSLNVFDAAVKCGNLEIAEKVMLDRKKMLVPGRTVTPEGTPIPRSECHVWTALPNYGLYQLYAGLKILTAGGEKISLSFGCAKKINAHGAFCLPQGLVEFDFSKQCRQVKIPYGVTAIIDNNQEIIGNNEWIELKK